LHTSALVLSLLAMQDLSRALSHEETQVHHDMHKGIETTKPNKEHPGDFVAEEGSGEITKHLRQRGKTQVAC